jgi:stress-induced morphogen
MAMQADDILKLLEIAIPGCQAQLKALVDDGDHYQLTITSSAFVGLSRIAQHQMVYAALGPRMGNELHALSIQTLTPQL